MKRHSRLALSSVVLFAPLVGSGCAQRTDLLQIDRDCPCPNSAAEQAKRSEPAPVSVVRIPWDDMAVLEYDGRLGIDTLENDVRAFYNRDYVYYNIPDALRGFEFMRTGMAGYHPYNVTVRREGYVLVSTVAGRSNKAQLMAVESLAEDGWVLTALGFNYSDPGGARLQVWMKRVNAGVDLLPGPDVSLAGGTIITRKFARRSVSPDDGFRR